MGIPLAYLAHGYIFGNKIVKRRGTAVLFAFLWSSITSSGKCILFFAIDVFCCEELSSYLRCCSERQECKVNWKHFKVWQDLGFPDMLILLKDKNLLKEIRAQALEMVDVRTDVRSEHSVEMLGRDSDSFFAEELKNQNLTMFVLKLTFI